MTRSRVVCALVEQVAEAMHGAPLDELHPDDREAWERTALAALDALRDGGYRIVLDADPEVQVFHGRPGETQQ